MATINPTSIVKLYTGIPLDNTYTDTLYFDSIASQTSYFSGVTPVATFTNQMYQRVTDGVFEANCSIETIYNCNYMAFQNTGFENKWFYAFVTEIEYINNHNTRVHFEIDVMQTWLLNCEIKRCFIERQHSVVDNIGTNILPEPVSLGEYVYDEYEPLNTQVNHYAVAVMIVQVEDSQTVDGNIYDNVYSGANLWAIDAQATDVTNLINTKLSQYITTPEAIVAMYMVPLYLLPLPQGGQSHESAYSQMASVPGGIPAGFFTSTKSAVTSFTKIGNYTPKNKKLFTYPYHFYHVDNGDGASLDLRYEFFKDKTPKFKIDGCITTPVQLRLTPMNYKGVEESGADEERAEFLTIASYPVCSWNYDTYRAWVAQNSVPMEIQGALAAGGLILSLATGGAGAALVAGAGALATAIKAVSQTYTASIQADTCKGNINSGNVNFSSRKQTFYGSRCYITEDHAEMIDNFFTMYGYAYNKIGIPNTHSRPHWNYVKTNGLKIIGGCPADALAKIKQVFDNGVTFWKSASEVGNYYLDNAPT